MNHDMSRRDDGVFTLDERPKQLACEQLHVAAAAADQINDELDRTTWIGR